jgi:hypothetical protein
MVLNTNSCCVCELQFTNLEVQLKCDSCPRLVHHKCTGLSASEIKCLSLKNRKLKYFCDSCEKGLSELPDLKKLISALLVEVESLKNNASTSRSDEFIINEMNERNFRAANVLFYNIPECTSSNIDERVLHDKEEISKIINATSSDIKIPIKVIRLGKSYQPNKHRPIKAIFSSAGDAFDILKNKKHILSCLPPTNMIIGISSDRTLFQRDQMKKLREKLAARQSSGEQNLTIKFVKGIPSIVNTDKVVNNSQNF